MPKCLCGRNAAKIQSTYSRFAFNGEATVQIFNSTSIVTLGLQKSIHAVISFDRSYKREKQCINTIVQRNI
jgi:hypothetical protein